MSPKKEELLAAHEDWEAILQQEGLGRVETQTREDDVGRLSLTEVVEAFFRAMSDEERSIDTYGGHRPAAQSFTSMILQAHPKIVLDFSRQEIEREVDSVLRIYCP